MKKFFIFAIFAIAALMLTTPAMALDQEEHVIQAPNGLGDLLIFPHYIAVANGWETKLTVTNTDDQRSVVAKLVVRSAAYSEELLDFLIYLSPADVWTGKVYYNETAGASMYSEDDSVQSGVDTWASADAPLDQPLAGVCSADPLGNVFGYIEVIEVWSSTATGWACSLGAVDFGPTTDTPVAKQCILEAYTNDFSDTNDTPFNVLTGHYEQSLAGVFLAADQATILRDYDQRAQEVVQVETRLGNGASNTLCEVEAALCNDPMNLPFLNNGGFAIHWVSFPTKLSVVNSSCVYDDTDPCDSPSDTLSTHVFRPADDYSVEFQPKYWDLEENTPGSEGAVFSPYTAPPPDLFPFEVNFAITQDPYVSANYPEGWFRYDFDAVTTCAPLAGGLDTITYTGVPGIGLAWLFNANGVAIVPASQTNGVVTYDDGTVVEIEPYYQYQNEAYNPAYYITVPAAYPGEFTVP